MKKKDFSEQQKQFMHDNPDNWKWIFYVNPKDDRVFVPKINPYLGWTLNFGNAGTYVMLILIAAIIVLALWVEHII
jgi:uncharacterized membrane protein